MFDVSNIINLASAIITESISHTTAVVTALPFMLLPMGFVFGKKFISMVKSLTMQGKGRRR